MSAIKTEIDNKKGHKRRTDENFGRKLWIGNL